MGVCPDFKVLTCAPSLVPSSIQLYEVFAQGNGVHLHYEFCENQGRLHTPLVMPILASLSHFLIIVNSSVNVLIYYFCGDKFRQDLSRLIKECISFFTDRGRSREGSSSSFKRRFNSFSDMR